MMVLKKTFATQEKHCCRHVSKAIAVLGLIGAT